ncbi:MAG: hypothetical protein ACT4RN_03410 [Pseudonocardia sp.]
MSESSAASSWIAARTHPASYPGAHPESAFALVDTEVVALAWTDPPELAGITVATSGSLAGLLAERGLPSLEDRVPVLAYGGNRNPATLELKLRHYQYSSPGRGIVLPVLRARICGLDVVAGGLSSQGYLFADLHGDESTRDVELDVHVLLLDDDQLRVMHESEGTSTGQYDVAVLGGTSLVGPTAAQGAFAVLAYVGTGPLFVSPLTGTPLALAAVRARGRRLPELDCVGMLAHALEGIDALADVEAVVAGTGATPTDARALAAELMRYLNGQWWYRKNTGDRRLRACERLEELLVERMRRYSPGGPRRLAGVERVLSPEDALRPDPALRLGRALRVHGVPLP